MSSEKAINNQSLINDTLYTLDSRLENVTTHKPMIVCQDDRGNKFICDTTQNLSALSDNINIIHRDNTHRIFTVIDDRIVWYGSISPLMKSYDGAAVIRLVNTPLAGKLTEIVKDGFTLI